MDKLIHVIKGLDENEIVVLGRDLNGHVGVKALGYAGMHGGWGCGTADSHLWIPFRLSKPC